MFKEIFTRLIRHLPSRLVHRDPLPGAQQTVNTVVPPSLSAHCLKMAVMPEEELWKTFDTHPEGLNQAEVESAREQHGENKLPAQQPSPWWVHLWVCYRNPFNILLTILGAISYATEDLFAAGVIALMVAISTLLNFSFKAPWLISPFGEGILPCLLSNSCKSRILITKPLSKDTFQPYAEVPTLT